MDRLMTIPDKIFSLPAIRLLNNSLNNLQKKLTFYRQSRHEFSTSFIIKRKRCSEGIQNDSYPAKIESLREERSRRVEKSCPHRPPFFFSRIRYTLPRVFSA